MTCATRACHESRPAARPVATAGRVQRVMVGAVWPGMGCRRCTVVKTRGSGGWIPARGRSRAHYRRTVWPIVRAVGEGQPSSARQIVVAVQALQIGRASSIVPRGSGWSRPPRRQSTCTRGPSPPGSRVRKRTEHRRIRPDRGIGRRSWLPSIGSNAMVAHASVRAAKWSAAEAYWRPRRAHNDAFVPSLRTRPHDAVASPRR
jgi:hypothetical protein